MREIKFRAWNKEIGAMGIVSEISWGDNYLYASFGGKGEADMFAILNRTILMQYTGLKDKNGKEIYEGDIVRLRYGFGETEEDSSFGEIINIDIVIFTYGCFCFKNSIGNSEATYWPMYNIDIIGNIYENPDLIKEV